MTLTSANPYSRNQTMGLTTAERNRRKRERKKREKEERRKQEGLAAEAVKDDGKNAEDVEIEYVAEAVQAAAGDPENSNNDDDMDSVLRRFQQRAAVVTDDEKTNGNKDALEIMENDFDEGGDQNMPLSKRKLREMTRPSVAELKRRVKRADLVDAHDVTSADPVFLIDLKSVPGTVPVPRHWGRKRKYLQGKRGFEKQPFQLPDFIVKTGITEVRDTLAEDEGNMSAKQRNRSRVAPKMGAMDVDYRTLHDAFFKHQTKPANLTLFGDLYYEGKELETKANIKPGGELSPELREGLGMASETSPPPWLINMQRYGPPPSYPNLKLPGLNAPLPNEQCQYGYHNGGWGKPPVDAFGRPLYGGNPFDKPGGADLNAAGDRGLVTSDGKTIDKDAWGTLPIGLLDAAEESEEESEDEESSAEEMEESEDEEVEVPVDGIESVLPPPPSISPAAVELRKQAGDETPFDAGPKQLYTVLEQQKAGQQSGSVFSSELAYKVPGATEVPEGAESVLSKAVAPIEANKKNRKKDDDDDDAEHLDKNFKF